MIIALPFYTFREIDGRRGRVASFTNIVALQVDADVVDDFAIHYRYNFDETAAPDKQITINDGVYVVSHVEAGSTLISFEQKFRALAYVEELTKLVAQLGGAVDPVTVEREGVDHIMYMPNDAFVAAHAQAREIAQTMKRKTKKEVQAELQGALF